MRSSQSRLDAVASQPQHVHKRLCTLAPQVLHPNEAQLPQWRRNGTKAPMPRCITTSRNLRWFFSFLRPWSTIELLLKAPWTVAGHGWCCTMNGELTSSMPIFSVSLICVIQSPKMLSATGQQPKFDLRGPPGRLSAFRTRSVWCSALRYCLGIVFSTTSWASRRDTANNGPLTTGQGDRSESPARSIVAFAADVRRLQGSRVSPLLLANLLRLRRDGSLVPRRRPAWAIHR